MKNYSLFINGEFKDSGLKQEIINPATGAPIASVGFADAESAESAIDAARKAYDNGPWRSLPLAERKEYILKIAQAILEQAAELANLETLNTGKPIKESTFMDIPSAAQTFEYFARNLEKFLASENIDIQSPIAAVQSRLKREPLGVSVLIVPFNYPLLIASWKMAQSLAAGNTVILKPSSLTPLTVLKLGEIIHAAGFPPGVVNILAGSGSRIGDILCSDKRVDLISFTGSNKVGKKIITSSSANVKKLIMELGGKSAGIVLADADLEAAVNGSLCSIFLNQGQMCTAMSRIFVAEGIYDRFLSQFLDKVKRIRLGDGLNYETQMGPLISQEQRAKVIGFVEKAKEQGANLVYGGKIPEKPELQTGFFFEPAVFIDVSPQAAIFREEVFGPVVCINKFSHIDEAVKLANASDFGLASCIWSKDNTKAENLAKRINAGTIWINTYGMFFNEIPYGGFKQSGFGKELGREGFLEYTRLKNVIVDETKESKPLVNYWYGL